MATAAEKKAAAAAAEKASTSAAQMQTTPNPSAGKEVKTSYAGQKVIVGCKVGLAWLEFQVQEQVPFSENTQTGIREGKMWVKTGPVVRIRGTSYPRGTPPTGFPSAPEMVGGYALTRDVDKEMWDIIAEQNARNPVFMNGMVIAFSDIDHIKGAAKEREGVLSGLEPLDPVNRDQRVPKSTNTSVSDLEKGIR